MTYLNRQLILFIGISLGLNAYLLKPSAEACAVAMPDSDRVSVQIATEQAVIVWDEATHTEHFIRQATFDASAKDFGFLVPTPNTPTMAEADAGVFGLLTPLTSPEIIYQPRTGIRFASILRGDFTEAFEASAGAMEMDDSGAATAAKSGVEVIATQRVAGYDAVVLAADNADALTKWLRKHGYTAKPELNSWLAPYIAARWKITAFKIAKRSEGEQQIASSLVRMSFRTERPFFPYSEPADQRDARKAHPPRLLRVFMMSHARMEGTLGATPAHTSWPGEVTWANDLSYDKLPSVVRNQLIQHLALRDSALPSNTWLTTFEDKASPRPGTDDLYFAPAATQERVEPPPIIVTTTDDRVKVPVEFVFMGGMLVCGVGVWSRRSRFRNDRELEQLDA